MKTEIDTILQQKVNTPSDINEHLMTLKEYATQCNAVTEFGVRDGTSTWALLASRPKKLVSYDMQRTDSINRLIVLADKENIDFKFIEADTLAINIEPCDMLFIDTWHAYGQLIQELHKHSNKVSKYIIMHDTVSYGYRDESTEVKQTSSDISNDKVGLLAAIEEFLDAHSEWVVKENFVNNNGLMVIERVD